MCEWSFASNLMAVFSCNKVEEALIMLTGFFYETWHPKIKCHDRLNVCQSSLLQNIIPNFIHECFLVVKCKCNRMLESWTVILFCILVLGIAQGTYWLSCSNIMDAFIMSFLCTGPILMPAYWNTNIWIILPSLPIMARMQNLYLKAFTQFHLFIFLFISLWMHFLGD